MHAFSLVRPAALPGPPKLDYKLPSLLSLIPGLTGPTGFTQRQTPHSTPFESTRPAHAFGRVAVEAPAPVQTKLAVNRPGDRCEREADAVADRVMRMPAGPEAAAGPPVDERADAGAVQRVADHEDPSLDDIEIRPQEEEAQGAGVAQTLRPAGAAGGARSLSTRVLGGGGGSPLEPGTRRFMEARFGADFGRVRVHADGQAASLSRALDARAFTHRAHIWFGENEYRPETPEGRRVLAHELTHVVQQGAARAGLPIREQAGGAAGTVQRLGPLLRRTATGVYPWRGGPPSGDNYEVSTGGGSTVTAWVADSPWKIDWHYWCHGHSLGSFDTYGYSVYSGRDFAQVIADEYTPVPAHLTRAGDIAVWTGGWDHSARFTSPVVSGGTLDGAASRLSTKNGKRPLTNMSLDGIMGEYGTSLVAVFRRR